jgi:hypothetical protein
MKWSTQSLLIHEAIIAYLGNYRGISLINVIMEIITKVVYERFGTLDLSTMYKKGCLSQLIWASGTQRYGMFRSSSQLLSLSLIQGV